MKMKKIKEYLVDILFPPVCPICGKATDYRNGVRERICRECKTKIRFVEEPSCMKCGKHIEDSTCQYCSDCEGHVHIYNRGLAVYEYAKEITDSIYRFKYKNHMEYADTYGYYMAKTCGKTINKWNIDAIVPVPLYKSKLRSRGYNQSALMAQKLGENLHLKVDDNFLLRIRETIPMKSLDDRQRSENLLNAFACRPGKNYKNILLVDDIYTTGTTADACAKALKQSGVSNVYFVSLCIGEGF